MNTLMFPDMKLSFPNADDARARTKKNRPDVTKEILLKISEKIEGAIIKGNYSTVYQIERDMKNYGNVDFDMNFITSYIEGLGYKIHFYNSRYGDYFNISWK